MVTVLVTLLIFLVMITLHEFGHFIMAKTLGVNVLEFAIGMGPAIYKKQGKNTLYSVRIFPIGGYCSLEGEDGGSDSDGAFCKQKLWKRFLIVSAGAIFNLILGIILFAVYVGSVSPVASNVIDSVEPRSYLAETGVMPGDEIVKINGHKINIYNDITLYSGEFEEGKEISLTVKRNKEKLDFVVMPSRKERTVVYGDSYIEIKDVINGVEGSQRVDDVEIPAEYVGKTTTENGFIIGFAARKIHITGANILPQAWFLTCNITKSIYIALGELVTGKSGLQNMAGPVGVGQVVGAAVNSGSNATVNVLLIMAMLTVNLGIFNLLPLPALDGGRLFFMLVELLRGKPVPPEKEGIVHTIGLILLLILAVVVFFSDIFKLVG